MSTHSTGIVSASSAVVVDWHNIDWVNAHTTVRKLQTRIVKATRERNWRKVKSLQRLLTRSFSGKAIAIKRVTENQGKNTPGVDGVIWSTPEDKTSALVSLQRRGYTPLPLRRVYISKSNGKKRPLGIPTMKDRAMQALYLLALQPVAESLADKNSYGFRPERSTADALEQCHNALAHKARADWILEGDIRGCFDNIDHDWLFSHIPMDSEILRKWLKAGVVESGQLFPTMAGTPQGGIISPTLANLALDGLEQVLETKFGRKGTRLSERSKVNFVRYADDFIITGSSKELLINEVKPLVEKFLSVRGLDLSQEKTKVTHISEGFDFLGLNVRKYGSQRKFLIKPSTKNVVAFIDKVRNIVKEHRTARQEILIYKLNPVIRGWAQYHKPHCSSRTFAKVDSIIWRMTWRWACRRHPNKGKRWIKNRYFSSSSTSAWVFGTKVMKPEGSSVYVKLAKASDTKIRRHIKIKAEANPFDPAYESYFEKRLVLKMSDSLKGRKLLLSLWLSQDGKCLICNQPLDGVSGHHVHHLIRKTEGGRFIPSNLVMLHPNCHRQVHAQGLAVVKPSFRDKTLLEA